jgi:hypothetical protein
MSTTQTITTAAEIPKVLEQFYLGTGKEGETGYKPGLIGRGVSEIFRITGERPQGLTGQAAYQEQYAPLFQAGLMGRGSVADLSPFQQAVGQQLGTMGTPGQYQLGTQAGQAAASGLQALQNYQGLGVAGPQLTTYQLDPARQFSAAEVQNYMSPYMQSVVDRQQAAALKSAREAQLGQNLAAARQGTYGGARQTLLQGSREAGLQSTLADIQAKGLQSAFENAQAQFERDRAAQMGIGSQNLQAALGVQQLGAGQDLQAQLANQAAQQQAAQTRLGAAQGLGGLAGTFGQLGTQQLAGQLDVLKTQGAFGDLQRAIEQQKMDAQRQQLTDQAQYGMTQVGQLSNLLRGIPMQGSTQTATTPPPSFASQLTGLGLTGIGLYNMLGGGKG